MKAAAIIGGDQGNRQEADFYPTPPEATIALINFLDAQNINFYSVWEPACGDGAISKILESNLYDVLSTDLRRESGFGTGGVNFLDHPIHTVDCIITNPPFNLAEQFIIKSLACADIVCMLLKSQYWHAKSRVKLFTETKPAYILPLTWRPDFMAHTHEVRVKKVTLLWMLHGLFG